MSKDGLGATFVLDISDVARGVDGNSLTFRNLRKPSEAGQRVDLIVRDLAVGWLDRGLLPQPPQRGPAASAAEDRSPDRLDRPGLRPGRRILGLDGGSRLELLVETGVGMNRQVASDLIASDTPSQNARAQVQRGEVRPRRLRDDRRSGPPLKLVRTVEIQGEIVRWKERWTNTGKTIAGRALPSPVVPANRPNPVLPGREHRPGRDGLQRREPHAVPAIQEAGRRRVRRGRRKRLAASAVLDAGRRRGVAEIYSQTLALAAGRKHRFHLQHHACREGRLLLGRLSTPCGNAGGSTRSACSCRSSGTSPGRRGARRRKRPSRNRWRTWGR